MKTALRRASKGAMRAKSGRSKGARGVLLPQRRSVVLCALANDEAESSETGEEDGERGEGNEERTGGPRAGRGARWHAVGEREELRWIREEVVGWLQR